MTNSERSDVAQRITEELDAKDEREETETVDWLKRFIEAQPVDNGEPVTAGEVKAEPVTSNVQVEPQVTDPAPPAQIAGGRRRVNRRIVRPEAMRDTTPVTTPPTTPVVTTSTTDKPVQPTKPANDLDKYDNVKIDYDKLSPQLKEALANLEKEKEQKEENTEPYDVNNQSESVEEAQEKLLKHIDEVSKDVKFTLTTDYSNPAINDMYLGYLTNQVLIPQGSLGKLDLNTYITSLTNFTYNCFDSPDVQVQHSIADKVAIIKHLNRIFEYEFMDVNPASENRYIFSNLPNEICKFLWKHKNVGTSKIEYMLIKSFTTKLILNLNTNVELGLCNGTNNITTQFSNAIMQDINTMKYLQSPEGKSATSWKYFVRALVTEQKIYSRPKSSPNVILNSRLKEAWKSDFMLETLLANMLKTYVPSIALNYFYAMRSMYISARLISIYIDQYARHTSNYQLDLGAIGGAAAIIYENLSFIFRTIPRSLPHYGQQISEQFEMYISNHLVVGGQYYLLKMYERSLPVIANIMNRPI